MKRFKGLLRDTWWLWILLLGGGIAAGSLIDPIFYAAIPISLFAFFYFGFVRYDSDGNVAPFE